MTIELSNLIQLFVLVGSAFACVTAIRTTTQSLTIAIDDLKKTIASLTDTIQEQQDKINKHDVEIARIKIHAGIN